MKTFKEFIENKEDIENLLLKIYNLSWTRYYPETLDFLNKLSSKDPDIKELLDKIESIKELEPQEEKDVILKNVADSNFGNEDEL